MLLACGLATMAGSTIGAEENVHHTGPPARKPTGQPTGTRAAAAGSGRPCRGAHGTAACGPGSGGGGGRACVVLGQDRFRPVPVAAAGRL